MSEAATGALRNMLLVLGMHRSGTSALAGALAQLGVDFSAHLVPPAPDNPKGFFEHADVWQLDHTLFQSLGSAWDDPLPLPDGWRDSEGVPAAARRAQAILQRDFAASAVAGIKDPRMCRLLPLWRAWLDSAGFRVSAVIATREPAGVIASLARRDQLSSEHAAWVWLRYVLAAERDTRWLPRVVVAYENLMRDWRAELARVSRELGVAWPRSPDLAGPALDAFLEPGLQHHAGDRATTQLPQPLRGWVEEAAAALARAATGDAAHMEIELDTVSKQLHAADRMVAPALQLLRRTRLQRDEVQAKLTWSDHERAGLAAGNQALRENLARHAAELAKMQIGNAQLRENLARHVDELAKTKRELGGEIARLSAATARMSGELAAVYASHSWRITRPLRGALRLARGDFSVLKRRRPAVAAARTAAAPTPADAPASASAKASTPAVAAPPALQTAAVAEPESSARPDSAVHPDGVSFAAATGARVLIVTPDILGPIRNGGIGTAFAALAETLAEAGRAVTILYTLGGHTEGGEGVEHWQRHYADRGIRFVPVSLENGEPILDAPHHAWRSYRVYLWLKAHQADYDLVYFPEWKGEAYYALQARRVGLDFARLCIVVVTHSSTTWADSGNSIVPQKFDDLLLEFLERRVVEMADVVISPSRYMLDWMRVWGWRVPRSARVIQNLMPDAADALIGPVSGHSCDSGNPATLALRAESTERQRPDGVARLRTDERDSGITGAESPAVTTAGAAMTEWVFFGRLERRKGLLIFLAALARMPAEVRSRIQITFLGKAIRTADFDSEAVIRERCTGWTLPPKLIVDCGRDAALTYLAQPGRVAIIASLVENSPYTVLECLARRVPFVAADVGGIAELIHPDDRNRVLFKPDPGSLGAALLGLDGTRHVPPRTAVPQATTRQRWLDLQDELLRAIPAAPALPTAPAPHITVCLVHHDRPVLLEHAIDSLRQQTYAHFDVVLVDDGSSSAAARQYLDQLADEFTWRGWTLVRAANRYLGAARNTAARAACGDYVLFMDDDNLAKPDELAVFARIAQVTGADILTTVSDIFSDADGEPGPDTHSRQLWIPLGKAVGLGVFRNVFGDANALVRRKTFLDLGGFTEDYGVGHEDWEFFARATLAGADLQLVPEPLFWYRVNAKSMLRGGSAGLDHARSLRPYRQELRNGIGAALGYAAWLHRQPSTRAAGAAHAGSSGPAASAAVSSAGGRRALSVLTWMFRPHVRERFRTLLRESGWRGLPGRVVRYVRPADRGR